MPLHIVLGAEESQTRFIKYEGTQTSEKGYEYPVFKMLVILR